MNLIKDYVLSLLFVSIIYTFATYELSITIFSNSLQLMCGILINELNDFFTNNEIKEEMLTNHNLCEEDKIIIKTLMEKLTDEERQIIIMHVIGGLKHIDIAKLLDIKLSTALSKYHRAIKKLKAEWRKN